MGRTLTYTYNDDMSFHRLHSRALLLCLLLLGSSACGQKGDLTLPEKAPQQGAHTESLLTGGRQV